MCGNHISVLMAISRHHNWHEFSNADAIFPYITALVEHELLPLSCPVVLPPLAPPVPHPPAALTPLQVGGASAPCPVPAPSSPVVPAPAPTPVAADADASPGGAAALAELSAHAIALQAAEHAASLKKTAEIFQSAMTTGDFSGLTKEKLAMAASALTHQITTEGTKRGAPSTLISSLPQAGPKVIKQEVAPDEPPETDPDAVSLEDLHELCLDWGGFDPAYIEQLKTDPAARKAVYSIFGRTASASFDTDGSFSMAPPPPADDRSNVPVELRPDTVMSEPTFPVGNDISFSLAQSVSSSEAYGTLLAYHVGDVMPNFNRVYSTLESFFQQHGDVHRESRLRDEFMQSQIDTLENAVDRRTLIFRKLPPLIQNSSIDQSLEYLLSKIKDVDWNHIQSRVSHLVSVTETILFVTFTTDWACEAVLKFVKTSKAVTKWRSRDAAGNSHDSWIKCEPMVSTWTRLDSQFFSAMCDALGNFPDTPFHGQRLDVNQAMMQVWTPRELQGERRLLGQVSFQILPAAQRYFSVSIWVAQDLLSDFCPRFTKALLSRFQDAFDVIQSHRLATTLGNTRITPSVAYQTDITSADPITMYTAWRPIRYVALTPAMTQAMEQDSLITVKHSPGLHSVVKEAIEDTGIDVTQFGKGGGRGRALARTGRGNSHSKSSDTPDKKRSYNDRRSWQDDSWDDQNAKDSNWNKQWSQDSSSQKQAGAHSSNWYRNPANQTYDTAPTTSSPQQFTQQWQQQPAPQWQPAQQWGFPPAAPTGAVDLPPGNFSPPPQFAAPPPLYPFSGYTPFPAAWAQQYARQQQFQTAPPSQSPAVPLPQGGYPPGGPGGGYGGGSGGYQGGYQGGFPGPGQDPQGGQPRPPQQTFQVQGTPQQQPPSGGCQIQQVLDVNIGDGDDWPTYYKHMLDLFDTNNFAVRNTVSPARTACIRQSVLPGVVLKLCHACFSLMGTNRNCSMCTSNINIKTVEEYMDLPVRFPFPCPYPLSHNTSCDAPFGLGPCAACANYFQFLQTNPSQILPQGTRHPFDTALLVALEKFQLEWPMLEAFRSDQGTVDSYLTNFDFTAAGVPDPIVQSYGPAVMHCKQWIWNSIFTELPILPHVMPISLWNPPTHGTAAQAGTYDPSEGFGSTSYLLDKLNPQQVFVTGSIWTLIIEEYMQHYIEQSDFTVPVDLAFVRHYMAHKALLSRLPFPELTASSWTCAFHTVLNDEPHISAAINIDNIFMLTTKCIHGVAKPDAQQFRIIDMACVLLKEVIHDPPLHSLFLGDHRTESGNELRREAAYGSSLADYIYTQIASLFGVLKQNKKWLAAPNDSFNRLYDASLYVASESAQGRPINGLVSSQFRDFQFYEYSKTRNTNTKGNIIEALVLALCERGAHIVSWTLLNLCFHLSNFKGSQSPHPRMRQVI